MLVYETYKGTPLPVTRLEIADHISAAFRGPPRTGDQLVQFAREQGARSAVLLVLAQLPDGPYYDVRQLWPALPDTPIEPTS